MEYRGYPDCRQTASWHRLPWICASGMYRSTSQKTWQSTLPLEPHAQLCLARTLVLRAESQRNCQTLEVTSHAPGIESLSEEAFRSFLFAIQNTEGALLDQDQGDTAGVYQRRWAPSQ